MQQEYMKMIIIKLLILSIKQKLIDTTNNMKENNILDISRLLLIKNYADRQMEVEYPYPNMLPMRKPIDIFTGLGELRKRRVMRAIQRGKHV